MNYELKKAKKRDLSKLIVYKLQSIFAYKEEYSQEEKNRIENYVRSHIPMQLEKYKLIVIEKNVVGCVLVEKKDDGVLLDEIYLEENYRNQKIETNIIKEIIKKNAIIYLWVYKVNEKAISLYKRLGFVICKQTEDRYYMKYTK